MSRTDVSTSSPDDGFLNTPPVIPLIDDDLGITGGSQSPEAVAAAIAMASGSSDPPMIANAQPNAVDLPGGFITEDRRLVDTVRVHELVGYDEERLSRIDLQKNVAVYITEMLLFGVEEIDGVRPTKEVIRRLLIGDRDALMLGIRKVTYGPTVEFKMPCDACDHTSEVLINIDEDVEVIKLEDPMKQDFEVPLKKGFAHVVLLDGEAQEAFSDNIWKKTTPEVASVMLAKSVDRINGEPTMGSEDAVRALSAQDRWTLMQFINDHQPGPQLQKPIEVPCATCGAKYPIALSVASLFRL